MERRLRDARVAHLATIDTANMPHIVPMVFALVENRIYSAVDHKPKRTQQLKRLANIAVNPQVTVLADQYDDDWSRLWWVRADGLAAIVATGDVWESAIDHLAAKYPQYRGMPPSGAVIAIDIEKLSGWQAASH